MFVFKETYCLLCLYVIALIKEDIVCLYSYIEASHAIPIWIVPVDVSVRFADIQCVEKT